MPKLGMEPIRRAALVKATIAQIGETGSLDVTVAQIAKRAGMSSALAHHYFGSKEQIFLAAMRHILTVYAAEVRGAQLMAHGPRARIEAIVRAGFGTSNFRPEVISAWVNFYLLSLTSRDAARLLHVYQGRLRSNLIYNLRPLVSDPGAVATRLAGLIDGLYLQQGLSVVSADGQGATAHVLAALTLEVGA